MIPFFSPFGVDSTALEASHVLKASSGRLHHLVVTNTNAAARYIQLFDAAALPGDGTVPTVLLGSIASGATATFDLSIYGRQFANGIVVCNSTTATTKTLGSADSWFDALIS